MWLNSRCSILLGRRYETPDQGQGEGCPVLRLAGLVDAARGASANAGQLVPCLGGSVPILPRREGGRMPPAGQLKPPLAVEPGRDRRVDRDVPHPSWWTGAGPDRPDRAAPPAAARAAARPAPPARPGVAVAGQVRAGPGARPVGSRAAAGPVRAGRAGRGWAPSRRCGWSGWWSAAPMPPWARCWGPTGRARSRWPVDCSAGWPPCMPNGGNKRRAG
jgi:hypothetical protein